MPPDRVKKRAPRQAAAMKGTHMPTQKETAAKAIQSPIRLASCIASSPKAPKRVMAIAGKIKIKHEKNAALNILRGYQDLFC